jgi:Putative DNA-binding domain
MDRTLIEELLHEDEGATLDFKRDQYPFEGADDLTKSELLKDILAFANAWRRSSAYILIGVEHVKGGRSNPAGVATHHDDAKLQQFVNSKTNRPIFFSYNTLTIDNVQVGVICIPEQDRPFFLKKDYGKLKADVVYLRRGSSTGTANPEELHRMGAAAARIERPHFEENLKASLKGHGAASSVPPFGTGEPMHLAIDLQVVNFGSSPVFITVAQLADPTRRHLLSFTDICDENNPLLPGGRRKSTLTLLHHTPFKRHTPTQQSLDDDNRMAFKILKFICQNDSTFIIETGRGTTLSFSAVEISDEHFLAWPFLVTPENILDELGSKTLEDFEEKTLAAFASFGGTLNPVKDEPQASSLQCEILGLEYTDLRSGPGDSLVFVTAYPRFYHVRIAFTNMGDNHSLIKDIALKIGPKAYHRSDPETVIRIDSHDYTTVDVKFPVNEPSPLRTGNYELTVKIAIGDPITLTGNFPNTVGLPSQKL